MITKMFTEFVNSERSGGFVLLICTILSLILANSAIGEGYLHFWHQEMGFETSAIRLRYSIEHWVNDGLMAIFFLLVGLEIERELYIGELSTVKNALLPVFAAIGGMLVPAAIHFLLNKDTATQSGFGIPMATDIAFALGILSLLGNRVPVSLKIFLTAFAIIDDLGAILVIAIFYTKAFSFFYFGLAMAILGLLFIMNRLKIHKIYLYIIPGIAMWYCMMQSGVHATISGILLAFALPFGNGDETTSSYRMQHILHKPVAFIVLPVFALANTGVSIHANWYEQLFSPNSLGILLGLIVGKPLGVFLFSYSAVKFGIGNLPADINWRHIMGVAILGGIGFTMSIFITLLAFDNGDTTIESKIAIFLSSCIAGLLGYLYLYFLARKITAGVPSSR
ncbi:Na+/H+ antiporter NhaA [Longitalea luteola]|uniref:Na+/H+ antiporter NhaA n=1 Tax=Longitalea luteola TaxID=2812563 RepID=UPI001F617812|nr:Na+/H+ antiporter NhaA [Longitalea luteola]